MIRAAILAGAIVLASPASAAVGQPAGIAQVIAAFNEICLKPLDDQPARAAAAQAAPWNMKLDSSDAASTTAYYQSDMLQLGLDADDSHTCAITGELDPATSLASAKAAFLAVVPVTQGEQKSAADTAIWLVGIAKADGTTSQFGIGLKVSAASGRNLGTFNIVKLAAR